MKRFCLLLPACLALSTPVGAADPGPIAIEEVLRMAGRIDELLAADLAAKGATPLPVVSDEVFVRRAYVRIVGRIPTAQEARAFLDNESADKRTRLVEELAGSPGYDSSAFNYVADLLRVQTGQDQFGLGWHVWLRKSLAEDKPWNTLVHEMLSAEGHAVKDPAVGYYLRDRGMLLDNVSNTVQVFLGHQIGCAQCHDHPFDRWTQMEYYELAAFSGGIRYNSAEARKAAGKVADVMKKRHPKMARNLRRAKGRERNEAQRALLRKATRETRYVFRAFNRNEIVENPRQSLNLPDDYQYDDADPGEEVAPATLFGAKLGDVNPEDRRRAFAEWVTAPDNPYFTKVIANRLWDRTFGHGLVDPVDDWSTRTVGSHPEVLLYLEEVMKEVGYRLRDFERVLYHTRLFEREVAPAEAIPGSEYRFVGPQLRRLSAEALYDSFTVLSFGNTDDNLNTALEERWEAQRQSVLDLLATPGEELIAVGRVAREAEEARREFQSQRRELRLAMQEAREAGDRREMARLQKQEGTLRREAGAREDTMAMMGMIRNPGRRARGESSMPASEHRAPFRGDHLVPQFGGSDRNVPEAAHTQASVPQALTLLNGEAAAAAENRRSRLFEALTELRTAEERLDHLFLALYASRPTEEERTEFLPLAENDDLFTLARAMLTSKRFLFVQ